VSTARSPEALTFEALQRFLDLPWVENGTNGYLQAAAVLVGFDPLRLHPVPDEDGTRSGPEALDALLERSEPIAEGAERGSWSLMLSDRRSALRALGSRERMEEALAHNPERRRTTRQRMFERLLQPKPIYLYRLTRSHLAALATVHAWVDGILDGLPDPSRIAAALAQVDLLAPMRRLAGRHFVGRVAELDRLRRHATEPGWKPPLYVYGPGGSGKSTLLARFALTAPREQVIAYLDMDSPTLRADRPLSLLVEIVRQVQVRLGLEPGRLDGLSKEVSFAASRVEMSRYLESARGSDHGNLLYLLNQQLSPLLGSRKLLVIVDTLEEAQFLGPDVMRSLLGFLFQVGESLPGTRVVLSGRALPREYVEELTGWNGAARHALPPEHPDVLAEIPADLRPINVGELDDESARALLRHSLQQTGGGTLTEDELADVIRLVSRNPMCLRLAARLLRDEGVERLRSDQAQVFSRLRAEKIQALLYGRILRHVHGDTVKVAYPGLVVRRITPEVIREVLAGPCGLDLTSTRSEYRIFEELRREAALVEVDPADGSLRHRPDVRRTMLPDLVDSVGPAVVTAIDEAAVAFYERETGPAARAEEIYHRLRIRQPAAVLNPRWSPDAAPYLGGALEDLAAQERLWLAERLGVSLTEDDRRVASQEAWEDQAARSAGRYLNARLAEEALAVLRERTERLPRSHLYFLEAEACRFLGRLDEALRVARGGVDAATRAGSIDMALELLLQMAVIEESRGGLEAAYALVAEAEGVAMHSTSEMLRLRVQVTRLRLQRQLHPAQRRDRKRLRGNSLAAITDEMLHRLRSQPVLLREVAAELGKDDPRIAAAAVQTLGMETSTDAQARTLAEAIVTLNEAGGYAAQDRTITEAAAHFRDVSLDPAKIREWVAGSVTSADTRRLGSVLGEQPASPEVLGKFREYFRAGVHDSLGGQR
jgi:hypothetical protein